MEANNDQRILDLKKNIEAKKKQIGLNSKFSPITNCILQIDGNTYNINVVDVVDLVFLYSRLGQYKGVVECLEIPDCNKICGFDVSEWMTDIICRIRTIKNKKEADNLKLMEDKLNKLLSSQKKTELELDDIEKLLK